MDDLFREQILRRSGPVITGHFLGYRPSYTREIKIGQPLVLAVFVSATLAHLLLALVRLSGKNELKTIIDSHPISAERLERMKKDDRPVTGAPILTDTEWQALKNVCRKAEKGAGSWD